jgi:hypothetical protein
MSVWPNFPPEPSPALLGREGELVSISVTVEPRDLEDLLDVLAALEFPVNPQIYHDASVVYVDRDGTERVEPSTLVEFPAYGGQVEEIRTVLDAYGFRGHAVSVSSMLEEIHGGERPEPGPPGVGFAYRVVRKHATATGAGRTQTGDAYQSSVEKDLMAIDSGMAVRILRTI